MKESDFEKAKELMVLITTTRSQRINLIEMRSNVREEKENRRHYDDGLYQLHISQYRDGSGCSAQLERYHGNSELLDTIIAVLSRQLEEFEEEFSKL